MYLTLEDYEPTWKALRRQVMSHSTCKMALLVACLDVDAVCAAKMLGQVLQKDLVLHKIIPIMGLASLESAFKSLDDDISNVVLIGCGAGFDLGDLIGEEDLARRKVHIIDNHRPWNLENLFQYENVLCYDDGSHEDLQKYQEAFEYLATHQDEEDSEEDDEIYAYKKKREDETRVKHSKTLLKYINQGTYLYSTDTVQVYTLLTMIGETSKRNLWFMVVGVSALEPRAPEIYMSMYPIIRDEITRLSDPNNSISSNEVSMVVEMDFSLFLLREWSLYESMMHSTYISSKFRLWNEPGRKKLHKMLATIGVSLQEARQQWMHMNQSLKKELREKLSSVASIYGIEGVLRNGVVRKFGYLGNLSANDCAESIAAILEMPRQKDDFWVDNFWDAWSGLDDYERLRAGMDKAKMLQKAVVSASNAVFEKGQPKNLVSYRLAVVQDGPDVETLRNPLTLLRLGIWIADGCAEMESYANQPLVIASYNELENNYLVLGMAPRRKRDDVTDISAPVRNRFGAVFQQIASDINAHTTMDAFDSAVITIRKDDLTRFLESLATEMAK